MKTIGTIAFAAALCLASPHLFAADGVLIVEKTTTGTTTRTTQVQIEKDRMRAEMAGMAGQTQVMVFDGPKQVMTTINMEKKTYTELTKADADRMGAQMTDAMARMKEQMANIPPAQRAQMEAMMRGRMGGAAAPGAAPEKIEYRKTGTDKAGKWACDKYEGFLNNQKVSELCTVDPKALGFAMSDFEIARQMAAFFKAMIPQGADQLFTPGTPETTGFSGIPVRRISYNNGQVRSTTELTDVTRQSFPASSYEVPAGFQKQAMFGGRGPQ